MTSTASNAGEIHAMAKVRDSVSKFSNVWRSVLTYEEGICDEGNNSGCVSGLGVKDLWCCAIV